MGPPWSQADALRVRSYLVGFDTKYFDLTAISSFGPEGAFSVTFSFRHLSSCLSLVDLKPSTYLLRSSSARSLSWGSSWVNWLPVVKAPPVWSATVVRASLSARSLGVPAAGCPLRPDNSRLVCGASIPPVSEYMK